MAQVLAAPGAPGGNRGGGGGPVRRQPLPEPGDDATDEEVLEWGASLAEENIRQLTSNQLMRLVDAFNNGDFMEEDFVALAELVQYQGFNPALTAKALWLVKKAKEVSNEKFRDDITLGCVLFLTRGTNLVNMVKRMSEEGQKLVNNFVQQYAIKKGQVNADELTLSRIALTFYPVTIQAARAVSDMLPFTLAEMRNLCPGYPAAMMTQAFTSAIPVGKAYENDLAQAHCLFLIEFAKVINPAQREKGDALVLDGFISAFKAALKARRPERNPNHVRLLQDMGVLTTPRPEEQEGPVEAVVAAATVFRTKFGNMKF
uniref:Nucleoprotein n=1 Tax=Iftin tick virus TaxID=2816850 RepID=A0A8A1FWB7_9VIRU|nr:nucleoprotein [Iftin tick virus]